MTWSRIVGDMHHDEIVQKMGLTITGRVFKRLTRVPPSRLIPVYQRLTAFVRQFGIITVRQFYYHTISTGIFPFPRTAQEGGNIYQNIDRYTVNARLWGIIPFNSIADTTDLLGTELYDDIEEPVNNAIDNFRSIWWEEQEHYVEVWLEKRALARTFNAITDEYGVFVSCAGGYPTLAQMNNFGARQQRFRKRNRILYFGDLDPSGKDMPRNLRERFSMLGINALVDSVALKREDVEEYNLPRNPTKPKDTRIQWYIDTYGIDYAVELDALPPEVLRQKIRDAIEQYVDVDILQRCKEEDERVKEEWKQRIEA